MLCDSPDVDQWIRRDRDRDREFIETETRILGSKGWGENVQWGQSFSFAEGRVLEENGGGVRYSCVNVLNATELVH